MLVEKQHPEIDTIRQEAVHKRVRSQEWAGTSIQDLSRAVGNLCAVNRDTLTPAMCTKLADPILSLCDQISVASEVAAGAVQVASAEQQQLSAGMSEINGQVEAEEIEVRRLRGILAKERKLAERRAQYEALAAVILKEPTVEESQKKLDDARKELLRVQAEVDRIEELKGAMAKEAQLFSHCVSSLEAFSNQFAKLLETEDGEEGEEREEGEEKGEEMKEDGMDTSS